MNKSKILFQSAFFALLGCFLLYGSINIFLKDIDSSLFSIGGMFFGTIFILKSIFHYKKYING